MKNHPVILRITNKAPNTKQILVNGVAVSGDLLTYVLHLPLVEFEHTNDDKIKIILLGTTETNPAPLNKGICLCITPETQVSVIVAESMHIAIDIAHKGPPEGVHCGDGSYPT